MSNKVNAVQQNTNSAANITNVASQYPTQVVAMPLADELHLNQEQLVAKAIDNIISDRILWQDNELKASNESLYDILTSCYKLFKDMKAGTSDAKVLLNAFHRKYPNADYGIRDTTHLMNKVIIIVFGEQTKKNNKYASALRIASENEIAANHLADYLVKAGGIEEVTRSKKHQDYTRAEMGRSALYGTPITTIKDAKLLGQFSETDYEHGVIFLASYDAKTKSFPIYRVVLNKTAIKATYSSLASSISDKEKNAMIADLHAVEAEANEEE